jgi:CheY-like chemotaxis protein
MDLHMPEMDGYETTETIRNISNPDKKNIPIIALTAAAIKGEKDKCFSAGMNDYISKPFEPEELFRIINKNLGFKTTYKHKQQPINQNKTHTKRSFKYINLSYLESIGQGDSKFQNELLTIFKDQIPKLNQQLNEALESKNYNDLSAIAHKAKSSVAMLGIDVLKDKMETLEVNAKSEIDIENYPELVNDFETISIFVLDEIKDLKF